VAAVTATVDLAKTWEGARRPSQRRSTGGTGRGGHLGAVRRGGEVGRDVVAVWVLFNELERWDGRDGRFSAGRRGSGVEVVAVVLAPFDVVAGQQGTWRPSRRQSSS
jgi:hypothetical protein